MIPSCGVIIPAQVPVSFKEGVIQKCPHCSKLIHIPKEKDSFVLCPYCGQTSKPVPLVALPDQEEDESWKERPSRLRLIALLFLAILLGALLVVYLQTIG